MDDDARLEFVRRHEGVIRLVSRKFKRTHPHSYSEPDDLANVARMRIYAAAHGYSRRKGSKESAWVSAVAWNAMVDEERKTQYFMRMAQRQRARGEYDSNGYAMLKRVGGDDESIEDWRNPGFDAVDARATAQTVLRVLEPRERGILTLYYFHGMTEREVSRTYDLSESRVSQLLRSSMHLIRARFPELVGSV